jgi:hypothetical protein
VEVVGVVEWEAELEEREELGPEEESSGGGCNGRGRGSMALIYCALLQ